MRTGEDLYEADHFQTWGENENVNYETLGYYHNEIGANYIYIWRTPSEPMDITKIIVLGESCSNVPYLEL